MSLVVRHQRRRSGWVSGATALGVFLTLCFATEAAAAPGVVCGWGGIVISCVPNASFIRISAGANHNLALKKDGTVVAWGSQDVPAGLSGVAAISAGQSHNL